MTDLTYVFVTMNSLYAVTPTGWAKATSLAPSNVGRGWGGWEPLMYLARGDVDGTDWEPAELDGIRVGDLVYMRNRDAWAITSEVQAIIVGTDFRKRSRAEARERSVPMLLLGSHDAWVMDGEGSAVELLADGNRGKPVAVSEVPDAEYLTLTLTSDTHQAIAVDDAPTESSTADAAFVHWCEVCGREESLTTEVAFEAGWDFPPMTAQFGIVTPRTCPDCHMVDTAWWALAMEKKGGALLEERHHATVRRIITEQ